MAERTKGKWHWEGNIAPTKDEDGFYREHASTWLSGENGEPVLVPWDYESYSCGLYISEANAEFICKAVNSHDQLVEAIKFAYKTADKAIRVSGESPSACTYIALRLAHELQELAALEAAGE